MVPAAADAVSRSPSPPLVVGGVWLYQATHPGKQVTAYFSESIGVYPGSTVRVLGVPVGTVDAVQPDGHGGQGHHDGRSTASRCPAGRKPSWWRRACVSDRYVQLTPAYTGGPQLADGAVIPVSRTAVPVEVDQIYASLASSPRRSARRREQDTARSAT